MKQENYHCDIAQWKQRDDIKGHRYYNRLLDLISSKSFFPRFSHEVRKTPKYQNDMGQVVDQKVRVTLESIVRFEDDNRWHLALYRDMFEFNDDYLGTPERFVNDAFGICNRFNTTGVFIESGYKADGLTIECPFQVSREEFNEFMSNELLNFKQL